MLTDKLPCSPHDHESLCMRDNVLYAAHLSVHVHAYGQQYELQTLLNTSCICVLRQTWTMTCSHMSFYYRRRGAPRKRERDQQLLSLVEASLPYTYTMFTVYT